MSRFVQNGMVTRNSQISRGAFGPGGDEIGGGKAEEQGQHRGASESFTERQKMDRCASASVTVSSKMSRSRKTLNQPRWRISI